MDRHEHRPDDAADAADAAEARLTAYALDELDVRERAEVEALLQRDAAARDEVEHIRALAGDLRDELAAEVQAGSAPGLSPEQREAIEQHLARPPRGGLLRTWFIPAIAAALVVVIGLWQLLDSTTRSGPAAESPVASAEKDSFVVSMPFARQQADRDAGGVGPSDGANLTLSETLTPAVPDNVEPELVAAGDTNAAPGSAAGAGGVVFGVAGSGHPQALPGESGESVEVLLRAALKDEAEPIPADMLSQLQALGYTGSSRKEVGASAAAAPVPPAAAPATPAPAAGDDKSPPARDRFLYFPRPTPGTEGYVPIVEAGFRSPLDEPLSTFSIDVDTASYANLRRFLLKDGRLPPADAVRIEELVNYFRYDYPQPDGETPFAASVAVTECPWAGQHRLVRIGLKGREVPVAERAASNLVFLCDVSGSMDEPDKLPLLVASLRLLVQRLDGRDRVALVTYAGAAGLVLDSTECTPAGKQALLDALDRLKAGGSTAGAAGIQLAYQTAAAHFIEGGTNRVILATDGDFNVGISDRESLGQFIGKSAKSGVFLSVLGFGTGNLQDGTAETLADKGNGNYAYIDSLAEAQKVLVQQMGGTLITIAKDVKIQVEFNPARVGSYRLIGYENRALAAQDFRNDKKDAGEIGSGHTVTALYEVVPAGLEGAPSVDPLRYQPAPAARAAGAAGAAADAALSGRAGADAIASPELLYLKLRWKKPDADTSTELAVPVTDAGGTLAEAGPDARFAAAVAAFGMLLRDSTNAGDASFAGVLELAQQGRGADPDGYRAEFLRLVQVAAGLAGVPVDLLDQLNQLGYSGDSSDTDDSKDP